MNNRPYWKEVDRWTHYFEWDKFVEDLDALIVAVEWMYNTPKSSSLVNSLYQARGLVEMMRE